MFSRQAASSPPSQLSGCSRRTFSRSSFLLLWAALVALVFAAHGTACAQAPQVLHQHVRPAVADHHAALVGNMPADQQLRGSIVLPLRDPAALEGLLGRLSDPSSPDFRHFLTVAQFTEEFGPTESDFAAVVAFARAHGLSVAELPANRLIVPIAGTVAQINAAFHVQMNVYQHPTENRTFFSPDREPSLDLAVPVSHISGLDNYSLPKHMSAHTAEGVKAAAVTGSGPGGSYLGSDMRAAYYGGTGLDGNGQSVGILEFGGYDLSDVNLTFSNAGQSYKVPINNVLLDDDTAGPNTDDAEQALDIVQAIGMAPNLSQVRVYIGDDAAHILNSMASENIAKQLSCSWGWTPADPTVDDVFFEEMAAQGQSFFTSSGDSGAYDAAINPYFYPADDQYVTAVGGTHLTTNGAAGGWLSETVWNSGGDGSGGGISPDGISIPSWQVGLANAANGGSATLRNAPDVAMEGDFDNYACAGGLCSGGYAGTSFAAPRWAGFMALVNQQAAESGNAPGGLGFINPALYRLAQGTSSGVDFHDITVGNNQTGNQPVWFNAVAGYDLTTGWGSANGQKLIDDLAGPQVPGFWLASAQDTISLRPGGTGSATLTITGAGGFSDNVSLALSSALPAGVTASFSPNPATGTSTLTLSATISALAGSQTVTITGTSGTLTASTNVTVAVHTPIFTLSSSPATVGINQGASGTSTITVLPMYGFTGSANLSVAGLPAGVTAAFSPVSTTGSSTLTLTVSSTATPGASTLTVTGQSGALTATTALSLSIHGPSFTLSSYSVSVGQGSSGTAFVSVNDQYGFTGSVNLAVSGLPSGVTAVFSPNPTSNSSTLTFTVSNTASIGQSTVTITGTSGALSATTTLNLGVFAPTFTISSPGSLSLGQGASANAYVSISPQYGFTGNVTFSIAGLPTGVTAFWTPNPTTGTSNLVIAASSVAKAGQSTLTITGTSGTKTATATLTLGVYAPTFNLSTYSNLSIGQGTSGTVTVFVTPQYGFTGNVNLAVTGLPSGVTASFSPNPATGLSTLTLQASSTAALGQRTLTITGTSGTQTATATLTLGVYVPTFTVANYGGITVGQGTSGSGYLYVTPQYGFTGNVTMSVSGLPAGAAASFSPNPTTNNSTLLVTANSSTAIGQYTLTVTGTSGTQTASTTMILGIYKPTFTLSSYGSVTVGQGNSVSSYVSVDAQYGFSGSVALSITGLPSGVTAVFSPSSTTSNSTLVLTAGNTAPVGQYPLTISGTSGGVTVTTPLTLGVFAPTFSLSSPGGVYAGQGTSNNNIYLYVNSQYGFSGSVNLALSGLPSGVTAAFSTNPTTDASSLTLNVSPSAAVGSSSLTLTGTSGSVTQTSTFPLTIYAPNFSLSSSISSLNLNVGATGTGTVFVTPQYGFAGAVTLSASGLPSGVTASFSPNPTTGNSVLTFTAGSAAAPGLTNVTISGTSGSQTVTTSVALTINPLGFTLAAAPAEVFLAPGTSQTSTILLTPKNGYSGSATYAVTGLPAGVTASFSPNPSASGSTLTLAAASTATPITGTVTITATSGALTASAPLAVAVRPSQTASTTVLSLTSAGTPVSTVASKTTVTATATVTAGNTPLTTGQVNFCDIAAITCDALHQLGSAQLTNAGTAALQFIPGAGIHSYQAVFAGTSSNAGSSSSAAKLAVTAAQPSVTAIGQSGNAGNYTLTAAVTGQGSVAPTGTVTFVDTSNGNALLGSAVLSGNTPVLSLGTSQSPAVGTQPVSVASGDFNGDGVPDLAVANSGGSTVSILLGKGDGTFQAAAALSTGATPRSIAVGDFNRDGHMDLAVAFSNGVDVFLGNGDGTFTASTASPQTGFSAAGLTVGDYNRDGWLDLAVLDSSSSTLVLFLGNGDGSFTPASLSAQVGSSPTSLVQGDFNGDGILDFAVANLYSSNVTVLLGAGDGSFSPAAPLATGNEPASVAVADLNGDGKLDLVVGNQYGATATLLLGNGDGTFQAATSLSTGSSFDGLAIADLNGDGKADLLTANYYNSSLAILLGNGDGTFQAATNTATGSYPQGLLVGDWNGDGVQDVAVANSGSNTLTVLTSQLAQKATAAVTGISPLGGGQHAAQASYPGDGVYLAAKSGNTLLTAEAGPPKVQLSLSPASVTSNQALTVTVAVDGGSGNPLPSGAIKLTGGSYASGAVTLNAGVAAITIPAGSLALGTVALSATYTPDTAGFSTYTSATGNASVVVTAGAPMLTWSAPPAIGYGTALSTAQLNASSPIAGSFTYSPAAGTVLGAGTQTLSATFTPADAAYPSATASVPVTVNKAALSLNAANASRTYGTANPAFTGTASGAVNGDTFTETFSTAATASSAAGTYPIVPSVTGASAANYNVTAANGTLTIAAAGSTTNLLLSNGNLTFTSTVGSSTTGIPSGTVSFYAGPTLLGTGTLAGGVASYTATSFPTGNNTLFAQYGGDGNFVRSTVSSPILAVTAATSAVTVSPAGTASDVLSFAVAPGYAGTLQLSCSNLPGNTTCTFSPAAVVFSGNSSSANATVTIHTGGVARLSLPHSLTGASEETTWALTLGVPGLLALALKRRHRYMRTALRVLPLLLLLCLTTALVTSCASSPASNSSGSTGTTSSPTPATAPTGTYPVQILATGPSGLTQTTNVNVTVQ